MARAKSRVGNWFMFHKSDSFAGGFPRNSFSECLAVTNRHLKNKDFDLSHWSKAELPQEYFALNFLPWDFLLIKKLEIEKTKTTQCKVSYNEFLVIYFWNFFCDRFHRGYMLCSDTFLMVLCRITILTYNSQYTLWLFLPLVCCIQTNWSGKAVCKSWGGWKKACRFFPT